MFYGGQLDKYDSRDYTLRSGLVKTSSLPRTYSPDVVVDVKSQSSVSSCVAHAMSSILEWHDNGQHKLSTNFIYGIQKQLFNKDTKGMYLRDACKIARTYGDMLEADCRYNTEVPECHSIAEDAFLDHDKLLRAEEFRICSYYNCYSTSDIKYALVNHGPVLALLKWYNSYTTDADGVLVGVKKGDYGYHAVMIYGYNDIGFLCQNSWGIRWGNGGRFILPYSTKIIEAKGLIDWDGESELSKPYQSKIADCVYKGLNAVVNAVFKMLKR